MNIRMIIFLIGIIIATSFAYTPIVITQYPVNYDDEIIVDGKEIDWSATKTYLYDMGDPSDSYFRLAYTKYALILLAPAEIGQDPTTYYLCGFFYMRDGTVDDELDEFTFNYDSSDADFAINFARDGKVYDGSSHEIDQNVGYLYDIEESGTSWAGEFCFPYDFFGITAGTTTSYGQSRFKAFDYGNNQINYYWPQVGTTYLISLVDKFEIPADWCNYNVECTGTEYCNANECTPVTGICGYAANHIWNDYACCADADCFGGKVCSNHTCTLPNACTANADCADDKFCAPAAPGDQCLSVPLGVCGYVADHVWHDYECCADQNCQNDEVCTNHKCDVPGAVCDGTVNLELNKLTTETLIGEISGLDDCEGKIGYIKKNSCSGQTACIMELDSNSGSCTFTLPDQDGWYTYVACVDIDDDGSYSNNEKVITMIQVNKTCGSLGCTPSQWGPCVCVGSNTNGMTIGQCIDNCGSQLTYNNSCGCQVQPPQINTTTPQNNSQQNGRNTSNNNNTTDNSGNNGQPGTIVDNPMLVGLGAVLLIIVLVGGYLLLNKPGDETPEPKAPITKSKPKEKTNVSSEIDLGELDKKPKK